MLNTIKVAFRFPVKQLSPFHVEVTIPRGPHGVPVINPQFSEMYRLTDEEIEKCEERVLRAVAIVPEGVDIEPMELPANQAEIPFAKCK